MNTVELGLIYKGKSNLICPRCNSNYLHHSTVTVFDRNEDEKLTSITEVIPGLLADTFTVASDIVNKRNPSPRRHGLVILFKCENCGDGFELAIGQHKGVTTLEWRFNWEAEAAEGAEAP